MQDLKRLERLTLLNVDDKPYLLDRVNGMARLCEQVPQSPEIQSALDFKPTMRSDVADLETANGKFISSLAPLIQSGFVVAPPSLNLGGKSANSNNNMQERDELDDRSDNITNRNS